MGSNSILNNLAAASLKKQSEIAKTNVKDLPEDVKKQLVYLKNEDLVNDPNNKDIYRKDEVEQFAKSMRQTGFIGVIVAYELPDGKYMISSGHRRRMAGIKAGIKEFPVFLVDPPKADWQRILRLVTQNRNNRVQTPMEIAREIQMAYAAHEARIKAVEEARKNGLEVEGRLNYMGEPYPESVHTCVAVDLGLSAPQVSKYKQLLDLIPEIQELVETGDCPWSKVYTASKLPVDVQRILYNDIRKKLKITNDKIDGDWVTKVIEDLSHLKRAPKEFKFDPNDTRFLSDQLKDQIINQKYESNEKDVHRARRQNGARAIKKHSKELRDVFAGNAFYKSKDIPVIIETLNELQQEITKKIEELKQL